MDSVVVAIPRAGKEPVHTIISKRCISSMHGHFSSRHQPDFFGTGNITAFKKAPPILFFGCPHAACHIRPIAILLPLLLKQYGSSRDTDLPFMQLQALCMPPDFTVAERGCVETIGDFGGACGTLR